MTDPNLDQVTAEDMMDEPDFAGEHDETTFSDDHTGRPDTAPDESTPSDYGGGASWRDPQGPV